MIIAKAESQATDNIYLHRALNFYMEDGRVISSRDANWHKVELKKVQMLELLIRGKTYRIRKSDLPSSFVEFIHFRSKGIDFKIDKDSKLSLPQEHNTEVDFITGDIIRNYARPVTKGLPTHFHPQSSVWERGVRS